MTRRAHLYTLKGVCVLRKPLHGTLAALPHRENCIFPATACAVYPFAHPTKADTLPCKLSSFMGFCIAEKEVFFYGNLPLQH